jgi:ABC-type nitrate/sulfonate/bicarbonate transport system permease component
MSTRSSGLLSTSPRGVVAWPVAPGWLPALVSGVALVAWELAVRVGLLPSILLPAPSTIVVSAGALLASGTLSTAARVTVTRLVVGLALGGAAGLLLGLAMGWSRRLRTVLDPFVAGAHAVPKIAILPLVMIVFGVGESPKVFIASVGAFFPMLIATMDGVRQINPIHFQVAENYGARWPHVFSRVLLPACLPSIVSGLRLAINAALLLTIAVEMISGREGLGVLIWTAWETMRTEQLYVSVGIILVLGVGSNIVLQRLATRFILWRVERDQ